MPNCLTWRGCWMGAMLLALLPGGVAGPIAAASIHDHFGSYAIAFQIFAALNLLAVVALFGLRNERADPRSFRENSP